MLALNADMDFHRMMWTDSGIRLWIRLEKKQVDGVIVANMSVITDNLIDAFIKVAQVQAAGGIIVTVDDGRLAMKLRGFRL